MPVNARAAVPPGIGLLTVVHAHKQDVLRSEPEVRGEVVMKGGVAVGMQAQGFAVDPDLGPFVHPFELDKDSLVPPGLWCVKGFAITTHTGREITHGTSPRRVAT